MGKTDHMELISSELDLFPTLLMETDLTSVVDPESIITWVYHYMDQHHNDNVKGGTGWGLFTESYCTYGHNRHVLDDPFLKPLRLAFQQVLDNYTKLVGIADCKISTSWFNYTRDGGFVKPHRHAETIVSLVYYPSFPAGAAKLKIDNPWNKHIAEQDAHFFCNIRETTPYTLMEHEIDIKEGHIYAFPGWAVHHSEESQSGERIVIPANCSHINRSI